MFFWFLRQKKLKMNLSARILLPLVGEGGPAKRDRIRDACAETASRASMPPEMSPKSPSRASSASCFNGSSPCGSRAQIARQLVGDLRPEIVKSVANSGSSAASRSSASTSSASGSPRAGGAAARASRVRSARPKDRRRSESRSRGHPPRSPRAARRGAHAGGWSRQRETHRERTAFGAGVFVAQPRLDRAERFRFVLASRHIDAGLRPARSVERDAPRIDDTPIGDGDAHRALRPVSRTLRPWILPG